MSGETLQNSGHIRPAEVRSKVIIERGHFSGGRALFNHWDVCDRSLGRISSSASDHFILRQSHQTLQLKLQPCCELKCPRAA